MGDLAIARDVEDAWRPLTLDERRRVTYWIGRASRRIHSRWPDVAERISAGTLDREDVRDVVVDLVLAAVDAPPVRGARSWQVSSGAESRSVTLGDRAGGDARLHFTAEMIEVFEGRPTGAAPQGSFPPARPFDDIFPMWREGP